MTNGKSTLDWFKGKDWYEFFNSIIIWLTIGFVGFLVVLTSGPDFSSFGQNQLLMLGIITLLLLFRYIRKIKIGDIIEAELGPLEKHVDTLLDKTATAIKGSAGFASTDVPDIREELLQAKGNIENIKAKARRG